MQAILLRHLRRNAVAYLALFVALGGTSFAAASVITGKTVKNSSLTGADIKNSSLTGGDVKDKSLTASDFSGLVQGPRGPKGDTGRPGAQGEAGINGTNGTNGTNASTHVVVCSNFSTTTMAEVSCNTGETVTGGGGYAGDGFIGTYPKYSDEGGPATGWRTEGTGGLLGTYVYVLCASP